jgi:YD repeat-containing protein
VDDSRTSYPPPTEFSFEFKLEQADYLKGEEAARFSLTNSALLGNLTLLGAIFMFLGIDLFLHGLRKWPFILCTLAILCLLERRYLWRRRALRRWQNTPGSGGPFRALVNEKGIDVKSPASTTALAWTDVPRWQETEDLFVLMNRSGQPLFLPRFLPGDEDLRSIPTAVRRALREKAGKRYPRVSKKITQCVLVVIPAFLFMGEIDILGRYAPNPIGELISRVFQALSDIDIPYEPALAEVSTLRGNGRIFVIPIGSDPSIVSSELIDQYRMKYGFEITLLAPLAAPDWAKHPFRNQFIAQELIEAMKIAYPEHAGQPDDYMIGVTNEEMYIAGLVWETALNYRAGGRFVMISTSRLGTELREGTTSADVIQQRLRKLLTKNIGLVYYRMDQSGNPYSVLFSQGPEVLSLDRMIEDYSESDADSQSDLFSLGPAPCIAIHHHEVAGFVPAEPYFTGCGKAREQLNLEELLIDLRYGLFTDRYTEFHFEDSIPLLFSRVVRNLDLRQRAFGIGGSHTLNIFPVGDVFPSTWMDLVLEDGARINLHRTNLGFGYWDVVFRERQFGGTEFDGARVTWNWPGWKLERQDGLRYLFPPAYAPPPETAALIGIEHRDGSRLALQREPNGELTVARSPNGTELRWEYDDLHRVTRVTSSTGKQVDYTYDPAGFLSKASSQGYVTEYLRERRNMTVRKDGVNVFQLQFDASDRIIGLRLLDGRSYRFEYEWSPVEGSEGEAMAVEMRDSKGRVTRVVRTRRDYAVER